MDITTFIELMYPGMKEETLGAMIIMALVIFIPPLVVACLPKGGGGISAGKAGRLSVFF
jgi:hypothetical protein